MLDMSENFSPSGEMITSFFSLHFKHILLNHSCIYLMKHTSLIMGDDILIFFFYFLSFLFVLLYKVFFVSVMLRKVGLQFSFVAESLLTGYLSKHGSQNKSANISSLSILLNTLRSILVTSSLKVC